MSRYPYLSSNDHSIKETTILISSGVDFKIFQDFLDVDQDIIYCIIFNFSIRLFLIISIPSNIFYFRPPDYVISMELLALNFRCQCTQQKLQSRCAVLTFDPQLKKILTFSVKDRYMYQLNYFICIKDFNAETNTSLKLNLFSFFICGCQHHQRKTICLYVYISDIRQIVGYRTPVFIQRFPWHLHITITYNLPHLRL
jgi:hypothetical protein